MNDPETDRLRPSKEELSLFPEKEFPQTKCRIVDVGNQTATISHEIGIVPLAVTTGLTINFLRKPPATQQIIAVCTLLKVGRTLATWKFRLYSEGYKEPVAHAVGTYSIPPVQRSQRLTSLA